MLILFDIGRPNTVEIRLTYDSFLGSEVNEIYRGMLKFQNTVRVTDFNDIRRNQTCCGMS